jgi:hypothetical protein
MKNKKSAILSILVILFFLISLTIRCYILPFPSQVSAKGSSESLMNISTWENNGNPICTATGIQKNPQMCSDGAGGAIITWLDYRSGSDWKIYAQRINASGDVVWTVNGSAPSMEGCMEVNPQICSDGVGGAIITWSNFWIFAQRINATGALLWTENGTNVCLDTVMAKSNPQICSDGLGGAIIVWQEKRTDGQLYYDVYAQRVNASGALLWGENGTLIRAGSPTNYNQMNPQVCSDGAGGAIFTWDEEKSASHGWVYAQRINATGAASWIANGTVICAAGTLFHYPQVCSDGVGGAIIAWHDNRLSSKIYAQRITAAGAVSWTANGIAISSAITTVGYNLQICSDGAGGAIITWEAWRSSTKWDIDAQRINATGTALWPVDGIPICTASGYQEWPEICSDNASGAIITWQDYRTGVTTDIYAQRITAVGAVLWTLNGSAISTTTGNQSRPIICSYGTSGAVISWMDRRSGVFDIYATKVGPPNAPHLEPLNAIGNTILLNWTAISDVTIYYIYRNTSAITSLSGLIPLKAVSSNYTTDEVLGAGTYYYVIVAGNLYGNSTISNCQSKSITDEGDGIPGFELLPTLITLLLLIGVLPTFKFSKPPKIYT